MSQLNKDWLYYLASPYRNYPHGRDEAVKVTAIITMQLLQRGYNVLSPIVHGRGLLDYSGDQITGHGFEDWVRLDLALIRACDALVILRLPSWDKSHGIQQEVEYCLSIHKPLFHMRPKVIIKQQAFRFEAGPIRPLPIALVPWKSKGEDDG